MSMSMQSINLVRRGRLMVAKIMRSYINGWRTSSLFHWCSLPFPQFNSFLSHCCTIEGRCRLSRPLPFSLPSLPTSPLRPFTQSFTNHIILHVYSFRQKEQKTNYISEKKICYSSSREIFVECVGDCDGMTEWMSEWMNVIRARKERDLKNFWDVWYELITPTLWPYQH